MAKKLFGTDGIRGKANIFPMTPEVALALGKAVAKYFGNGKRPKVVIGKDTRLSGYMLETALTSGLVSMGADVLLVGPMPTPAIAHLAKSLNADAGIVLSASHNPAEDNGIKIFDGNGYKLPDLVENEIGALVYGGIDASHVQGDKIGKAYRVDDAKGRYIEFAKSTIGNMALNSLKIVLDCAHGAAYDVAPKIFSELGAEVIAINNTPNGFNINEGCGALNPREMAERIREKNADLGVALDGDADRLVVADEKGNVLDGDMLMAIFAKAMKEKGRLEKNTVVATVMSNAGFEEAMEKEGVKTLKADVGDRYVIEEMRKGKYNFGGEQSGHIVFGDFATTGDGIISALQLMRVMAKRGKKLSELSGIMEPYPQTLVNVKVKRKKPLDELKEVTEKIKKHEEMLGKFGRVLVRYSGTENLARVMAEGKDKKKVKEACDEIAGAIRREIGED